MISLKKPMIDSSEIEAVMEVLKSGVVAQGPKVKMFEEKFSQKCGAKFGIAVNSGTAALHCALHALKIGDGDEVICPSFSFISSATPILMCGATPVFVDIDAKTYNIDPLELEKAINPKIKAIIGVNLFGRLADWEAINAIASKHRIPTIEDAAQSHFAMRNSRVSGNFSDLSCFSFYATKNMMTAEGGMIVTNKVEHDENCRRFRQHGMSGLGKYDYLDYGYNYRTTDLNAAIGLCQIEKIDTFNQRRIEIAKTYNDAFDKYSNILTPTSDYSGEHVYHLYTLGLPINIDRSKFISHMKEKGIACGVYYPEPLSELNVFKEAKKIGPMTNCKNASKSVVSIPCEPFMTDREVDYVISSFLKFLDSRL